MFRKFLVLSLVPVALQAFMQRAYAEESLDQTLSRAEALYFEARFNESIQLLSPINDSLRTQPDRIKEKIATKLQLALANIGLNNSAAAKALLMEIYALDADYVVDAQQFSPKVVALANEAKTDQSNLRCSAALEDARKGLAAGDAPGLVRLLQSMKPRCAQLGAVEPDVADLLFKKGLADYRQGSLPKAAQSFRDALAIAPKHELASQYLELAENKLQVAEDRVLLDWQKNFQQRQFKEAGAVYRQIASFDDATNVQTLNLMGAEYRKALDQLVQSWNVACASRDNTRMTEIRNQISDLLPEPTFGADIRSKMAPCTVPQPVASAPPAPSPTRAEATAAKIEPKAAGEGKADPAPSRKSEQTECFKMEAPLALVRLKHRVEPNLSPQSLAYLRNAPATVSVKIKIDADGDVAVLQATGNVNVITNEVRAAVETWKFKPAVDETGARCVETEIPVVISRR